MLVRVNGNLWNTDSPNVNDTHDIAAALSQETGVRWTVVRAGLAAYSAVPAVEKNDEGNMAVLEFGTDAEVNLRGGI